MNLAVGLARGRTSGMALLMTGVLLAACGSPAPASPDPTDPREILARGLQNTAGLRTVRVAVLAEARQLQGPGKTTIDAGGDVDLASRELAVKATTGGDGSASTYEVVMLDGFTYTRANADDWSVSGAAGQDTWRGAPTTAQVAAAIEAAIRDPATACSSSNRSPIVARRAVTGSRR